MLRGIKHDEAFIYWWIVGPMLQKAIDKSQHDMELQDVFEAIVSRDMQLWTWVTADGIQAACVTQIITTPRKKICSMPLIGGSHMRDFLKVEESIVEWAREQGCVQLEGYCRDGWMRVLKNWKKVWTTMRRDI